MRFIARTTALALCLLTLAAVCLAQAPGGMGGAFSDFREKHKYTFQLMQTVRHIGEIDKDVKYALKPDQAKKVLAVLKPLRKKPKLTQDEAKSALKALKPIFTVDQLNAMARIKPQKGQGIRGPGGGPPGGGPGGAPGGRRPGGAPRMMDPKAMEDFNPFHVDAKAKDEFAKARAKRWDSFFSTLDNRAKGQATAKPAKKGK